MRNFSFLTLVVLLFLNLPIIAKAEGEGNLKRHTISGHIRDNSTGEDLIGATVYVKELKIGTTSNVYGFYSISLNSGSYTLAVSYVGYQTIEKTIELNDDITYNVELLLANQEIEGIIVTGEALNVNVTKAEMSTIKMDAKTIKEIPALMGEVDIIKAIQLLPGVQTIAEGSSGFSVRGGSMDQNLIQMDEATVYNASHLMGFFSVFNNDAIADVKLYKGDIPASSGGRLSSLLDVRMKNGNSKKYSVTGGIGTISSRLLVEGPIVKNKASFILSGRRTYYDLFFKLSSDEDYEDVKMYFYDLNGKVNYNINENNRVFISGYFGEDVFGSPDFKMGWANQTITVRWNHLFSKKLFSNFTAVYSKFDYELGMPEGSVYSFEWISNLKDYGGKVDFSYYLNANNAIRFGISSTFHEFVPGTLKPLGSESAFNEITVENNSGLESAIYVSNEQKIGSRIILKYGLRFSHFVNVGKSITYNFENYELQDSTVYGKGEFFSPYYGLEPRIGGVFIINERSSIKASYARTRQYIHLAQNSTAGTPLDIWFPSTPNVEPQIADQYALGYFRNFKENTIEASAEVYYKHIQNAIDFKDYAELLLYKYFEGELRFGEAWAYGIELMAKYDINKFNGWVSYTLSRTERRINTINNNEIYRTTYDKPHDVSIVINYNTSKRVSISAVWLYSTGSAVTFPSGRAEHGGTNFPIFTERNAYRMKDYHRLDLSLTWRSKDKPNKKFATDLNFSIYNVYNRKNPWVINFLTDEDTGETYAEMTYLFGIVPAITFNFKFN